LSAGLPAPTWVYADRFALPGPPVPAGQRALLGARLPPAETQDRMWLHTPRWTRRSKHVSSRSLSFLLKMPAYTHWWACACATPTTRHPGLRYPLLVVGRYLCWVANARKRERFPGKEKIFLAWLRQSASLLLAGALQREEHPLISTQTGARSGTKSWCCRQPARDPPFLLKRAWIEAAIPSKRYRRVRKG
jgi:hypothetical protein